MDMKKLLKRVGTRPAEIAYKLGVSEQTVRNWSNGVKEPTVSVSELPTLLQTLDCSLDELVTAVNESKRKRAERLARGDEDDN